MSTIEVFPPASVIFTLPAKVEPTNAPIIDQVSPCAQAGFEPLPVSAPIADLYLSRRAPKPFDVPLITKPAGPQWLTPVPFVSGRVVSGGIEEQPNTAPPTSTLKPSFELPSNDLTTTVAGPEAPSDRFVQPPVQVPASVRGVKVAAPLAPEASTPATAIKSANRTPPNLAGRML